MGYYEKVIKQLTEEYPTDYYAIIDYFETKKKKFFIEENYNYNLIPPDIRLNSYL